MAKDPAFLLYSKDWLQGTSQMMPEEKGVYIDLLAHQHQEGDLPTETKRLARMVGLSEPDFLKIWEVLKCKFVLNNNNRLVNQKLTEIVTERLERGHKNKIIGTLASVVRLSKAPYNLKIEVKKLFNINDFLTVPDHLLTERLTDWFVNRLKSIEDGDGDANGDGDCINLEESEKPLIEVKQKEEFEIKTPKKEKKPSGAKKERNPDSEPYWHVLRRAWVDFNLKHLHFKVEPIPKEDYSHMHRIIENLRERAVGQAVVWTEQEAVVRWEKFLSFAYTKDKWLHDNFILVNLYSQRQTIFKLCENGGTKKDSGVNNNPKQQSTSDSKIRALANWSIPVSPSGQAGKVK